jgi:predicted small lipoprotein YifL
VSSFLSLALGVFALAGCENPGLLYHFQPPAAKVSDVTHQLKQLQGNSVVDILWVIDNSGSMGTHQANVIANIGVFLNQFAQSGNPLNWKMGLISTDKSDPPYIGFGLGQELTSRTPGNIGLFQNAVRRLGTSGAAVEEGFDPLLQALRVSPDFIRPRSTLAVILVTDAEEQGDEPVPSVLNRLALHQDLADVVGYGIFWTNDLGCLDNPQETNWTLRGSRYGDFIQALKGKAYPLCSSQFGANLADLGKDLVKRVVAPRLFLDARPRLQTLRVVYQGRDIPAGLPGTAGAWYYDERLNAIVFHDLSFAPGDQEEVRVVFEEDNGWDQEAAR